MKKLASYCVADIAALAGVSTSLVRLRVHQGYIPRPDLSERPRSWIWSAEAGLQAVATIKKGLPSCGVK